MRENKQQRQNSQVTKKKLFNLLDQSTPSKAASPINFQSTPSEYSPTLSASSETASVSDLTSPASTITESEKDEAAGVVMDSFGFNGLKFDSIQEELSFQRSHGYELRESKDMNVSLMEAEVVADALKVARRLVLQGKDSDLTCKKLVNRLIEVILSDDFCGLSDEIGSFSKIISGKFATMILLLLLFILVASCADFFMVSGTQSSFNGPFPT